LRGENASTNRDITDQVSVVLGVLGGSDVLGEDRKKGGKWEKILCEKKGGRHIAFKGGGKRFRTNHSFKASGRGGEIANRRMAKLLLYVVLSRRRETRICCVFVGSSKRKLRMVKRGHLRRRRNTEGKKKTERGHETGREERVKLGGGGRGEKNPPVPNGEKRHQRKKRATERERGPSSKGNSNKTREKVKGGKFGQCSKLKRYPKRRKKEKNFPKRREIWGGHSGGIKAKEEKHLRQLLGRSDKLRKGGGSVKRKKTIVVVGGFAVRDLEGGAGKRRSFPFEKEGSLRKSALGGGP